jgi:hypothetical protein
MSIVNSASGGGLSCYSATQQFKLPNTQIEVTLPKALLLRPNGDTMPPNVKSDYQVGDNTSGGKDVILIYTLDLINRDNNNIHKGCLIPHSKGKKE